MRVLVVVRSSKCVRAFPVSVEMGRGAVYPEPQPFASVAAWIGEACARTSNDRVCRSLSVEVHAEGADCDHEVPHG